MKNQNHPLELQNFGTVRRTYITVKKRNDSFYWVWYRSKGQTRTIAVDVRHL